MASTYKRTCWNYCVWSTAGTQTKGTGMCKKDWILPWTQPSVTCVLKRSVTIGLTPTKKKNSGSYMEEKRSDNVSSSNWKRNFALERIPFFHCPLPIIAPCPALPSTARLCDSFFSPGHQATEHLETKLIHTHPLKKFALVSKSVPFTQTYFVKPSTFCTSPFRSPTVSAVVCCPNVFTVLSEMSCTLYNSVSQCM